MLPSILPPTLTPTQAPTQTLALPPNQPLTLTLLLTLTLTLTVTPPPPPLAISHPLQSPSPQPPLNFHVFLVNMYCAGLCCPSALRMALHCFPITSNQSHVGSTSSDESRQEDSDVDSMPLSSEEEEEEEGNDVEVVWA